jgi:hypothetical protein
MSENVNRFILEAINFKSYDSKKLEYYLDNIKDNELLREFILSNRIAGIIYSVLMESNLIAKLDSETRDMIKEIYENNKKKNEDLDVILADISNTLSSSYKYALLKGAYLIPCLYEKGQRVSNDIDILISQKDIDLIDKDLKENTFVQKLYRDGIGLREPTRREKVFARMNYGELIPYFKDYPLDAIKTAIIDVNISLDFQAKFNTNSVDKMLENVVEYKVNNGTTLYTLNKIDFLIHLCAHLFKEATIYDWVKDLRDTHLYKYCDIYTFLLNHGDDEFLAELENRILLYNLEKECYYTFINSILIFPCLNNNVRLVEMLERIKPENLSFMKEIYWPSEKKLYEYDMNFQDWIFCKDRLEQLKEVDNVEE